MDKDQQELDKLISEIEAAVRHSLICEAMAGESLRCAVGKGISLEKLADELGDYPAALQTKIDLGNRLHELLRTQRLPEALDALKNEGWLSRLDLPEDDEEAV